MDLDVNLISVGCETHVELCVVSLMFGCSDVDHSQLKVVTSTLHQLFSFFP